MKQVLPFIALLIFGCDMRPERAEWQDICISSHMEMQMIAVPQYDPAFKSSRVTVQQQQWYSVCDEWGKTCVAGKDDSRSVHNENPLPTVRPPGDFVRQDRHGTRYAGQRSP